jgi:putative ABC transport system permease protein
MNRMKFHFVQAARSLRRARGYSAAFILTIGLAIGVNSAVFSMINGVLLRPLPFQDAERILFLKQPIATAGVENATFSFMEIDDYRAAATTVDEFVEFGDWEFTVLGEGEAHRAIGGLVTSNYFGVLGMRPAIGRLLNEEDDVRGSEPVILLTDAYWTRVFGRDPGVVNRMLDLENISADQPFKPARIVGVLEPGLNYTGSRQPDFYVNYAVNNHYQDAAMRDARGHRMTNVFARLAPGATVEQARNELASIAAEVHQRYPEAYDPELRYGVEAIPWQEELTRRSRPTFLFLMGTVGIILLLAAANVTNLTLTRLIRKEGELSTRAALGASGRDLRLHLTAENVILGLAGASLGVLLAFASRGPLVAYASRFTVRAQEVGVDWTVLGATLGGGILLCALLAWLPGLPVAPGIERVASAQSKATDSRWRRQIQRGLVVSQLALSFTLLTGAGLLVRSLIKLSSVDPGFQTEQVLTLELPMGPFGTIPGDMDRLDWERALEEIRSYPGVRSAAAANWAPLSDDASPSAVSVRVDENIDDGDRSHLSASNNVSPEYFETLGIPLIAGRSFTDGDREGGLDVIILNQSMARAHFGDADPIGRRIAFSQDGRTWQRWYEIVGIVADAREYGMDTEGAHTYYRPAAATSFGPAIVIASQGDPGALTQHVRTVIHGMQPERPVENVQTLEALLAQDVAPSRLNAILFGSFSVLALVIAALGVFSTLAFSVSQRVREFGIRMALGADRGSVLRNVLGEGALVAGIALAVGAVGALLLGRFVTGLLFGVEPLDPVSLIVAAATLAGVALVAALLPALRATRIEPTEALRAE